MTELKSVYTLDEMLKLFALFEMEQDTERAASDESMKKLKKN